MKNERSKRATSSLVSFLTVLPIALANQANAAQFGDWYTGSTDDGRLYAGVISDSGALLSKACVPSEGNCYWYLVASIPCDKDSVSPALVSSSLGATSTQLTCEGRAPGSGAVQYRSVIHNPDTMDKIISSAKPVGIAVALDSGKFQVFRFSTSGGTAAITKLIEGAMRLHNQRSQSSTKDSTL